MEKGMNLDACRSHGLSDRFVCGICGQTPNVEAQGVKGQSGQLEYHFPLTLTVSCCGEKLTKMYDRSEVMWTQVVFKEEDDEASEV